MRLQNLVEIVSIAVLSTQNVQIFANWDGRVATSISRKTANLEQIFHQTAEFLDCKPIIIFVRIGADEHWNGPLQAITFARLFAIDIIITALIRFQQLLEQLVRRPIPAIFCQNFCEKL